MSLGYLLDTNILSAFFKGDRSVRLHVSEVDYALSSIVLGELYEWCLWPATSAKRIDWLRELISYGPIIDTDSVTAERFGNLSGLLKSRGIVRADNDLWIACQALQHDLVVVTRDSDFDDIPGLVVERW